MEPHRKKQIVVILSVAFSLLLLVGGVWGKSFYRLLRPIPPSPPEVIPVEFLWAKAFPGERETATKSFVYDAVARVRNGAQQGIERLDYSFELFDAEEVLLATRDGVSYLRGDEAKYVIENSIETERAASRVRFVLKSISRAANAEEDDPILLQSQEYVNNTVRGVVLNQSAVTIARVDVGALLFDKVGNPVRARRSYFTRLLPQEERGFELYWNETGSAASAEVQIGTNVFDRTNYLYEASGTPSIQR